MAGFVCLKKSVQRKSFRAQTSVLCCSVLSNSAAPWTTACQAPPSTGFSRQEYRSGFPLPPPGALPHPGIKPVLSLVSPVLVGRFQAFVNYVDLISWGECVLDPRKMGLIVPMHEFYFEGGPKTDPKINYDYFCRKQVQEERWITLCPQIRVAAAEAACLRIAALPDPPEITPHCDIIIKMFCIAP